MRESDDVRLVAVIAGAERLAHRFGQGASLAEHLIDGEPADRHDERWLQDRDLALEERAAAFDLVRVWPSIAAAFRFARKASRYGTEVHLFADGVLIEIESSFEPTYAA